MDECLLCKFFLSQYLMQLLVFSKQHLFTWINESWYFIDNMMNRTWMNAFGASFFYHNTQCSYWFFPSNVYSHELMSHDQGCQIFRFLRKTSAFRFFFRIFPQFRFFPLFENFLIHSQLTVFKKQFAIKESFLVRVWPLLCKVCKIMGKRSIWIFFT